jgi:hypothetical protein
LSNVPSEHSYIESPADFGLGFLQIPERHFAAIGLLDSNFNFAAKFIVSQPLHIFGFAKPAIQFPTLLRGELFRGGFDFGNCAHKKNLILE